MISRQLKAGLLSYPEDTDIEPKSGLENGLFLVGQGSKSIFWYWEIDTLGRTYREFKSVDFEVAMEAFQTEDWDLWPLQEGMQGIQ
jgi:hypothetical protein